MDPLSHAALGAGWAVLASGRERTARAGILGGLAAMTPDLDIFIGSSNDPLAGLEYHRHFTHALSFIPFGALICTVLFYWLYRERLKFREAYLSCFLGYASHGVLDACTTYGTQLFWPFSDVRIAWSNVSVVDPLFTVPVLALVVLASLRSRRGFALAAVAWAVCYLGLGVVQSRRAAAVGAELAAARGHSPSRLETKPAFASVLLWKSIYEYEGRFYIDAVRVGGSPKVFEGESVAKLDIARQFPWLMPGTQQAEDLERFRRFSGDYLAPSEHRPGYIIDMRYSLVPNRADGLWGIQLNPGAGVDEHAEFITTRRRSLAEGRLLLEMLFR